MKFKLADFCAGTGGFSLGFESTKLVQTIFANDIEPSSKKIFDANNNIKLTLKNIHDLSNEEIPSMDILTAGFSCQPFSLAGKKMGFNDPRSNIFWKLIEIINYHKPLCVVFENVKNLTSHNNGETLKTILNKITEIGYTFKYKILNTSEITCIPQNRERIFIVCFKNENHTNLFKFPENNKDKLEPIKDFLLKNVNDKYYYKSNLVVYNKIVENITKHINTNTIYQYRRHYIRENKSKLCPTLTANMGSGGHNVPLLKDDKGIRKLTPYECFKLQGFTNEYILPNNLSDSMLYKLAGNGVTVDVVKKIAQEIIKVINFHPI